MTWKDPAISVGTSTALFGSTQILGPNDWVRTAISGVGPLAAGGRSLMGLRRSGQGAAGYVEDSLLGFPGIHDLIDPTTPKRNRGFEIRDIIQNVIAVGACSYAWGIHDLITANDQTSLVGLGFEHDNTFVLKTFLKDAPANALPPRVIHQTVTAALANVAHELAIIVDGNTKTIYWYIDGALVDQYTPVAPLDQTGGTGALEMVTFRMRGVVPSNGDMSIYRYGGGIAQPLLILREFP